MIAEPLGFGDHTRQALAPQAVAEPNHAGGGQGHETVASHLGLDLSVEQIVRGQVDLRIAPQPPGGAQVQCRGRRQAAAIEVIFETLPVVSDLT